MNACLLTIHTKAEEVPEVEYEAQRPAACHDTVTLHHQSSIHVEVDAVERVVKTGAALQMTNEKCRRGDKNSRYADAQPYL